MSFAEHHPIIYWLFPSYFVVCFANPVGNGLLIQLPRNSPRMFLSFSQISQYWHSGIPIWDIQHNNKKKIFIILIIIRIRIRIIIIRRRRIIIIIIYICICIFPYKFQICNVPLMSQIHNSHKNFPLGGPTSFRRCNGPPPWMAAGHALRYLTSERGSRGSVVCFTSKKWWFNGWLNRYVYGMYRI